MTPSTSVLSLSEAITPNRKHCHVQICLHLDRLPAEMFPDLGFLTRGACGNRLSPNSDSDVRQGHTNANSGGMSKQVRQSAIQCRQFRALPCGLCM